LKYAQIFIFQLSRARHFGLRRRQGGSLSAYEGFREIRLLDAFARRHARARARALAVHSRAVTAWPFIYVSPPARSRKQIKASPQGGLLDPAWLESENAAMQLLIAGLTICYIHIAARTRFRSNLQRMSHQASAKRRGIRPVDR